MALQWTPDLSVGYPHIDAQHQELIRRFNDLLEACRTGRGRAEVSRLCEFLDDYVVSHFSQEEELMTRRDYPDREEHFAQHRYFKEKLKDLKRTLATDGANTPLVITTNKTLLDWILRHIKQVDVRLGAYLRLAV
jgi:hemerythrin